MTQQQSTDNNGAVAGLPVCEYRATTDKPNVFYCRHSMVHAPQNLVSPAICRICGQYDQ